MRQYIREQEAAFEAAQLIKPPALRGCLTGGQIESRGNRLILVPAFTVGRVTRPMKLAVTVLAICTLPLAGQELKHLSVPTVSSVRPIDAAAHEVIREAPYIHLKGSVEIKTPVCLEAGPDNAQHCSGYVVLRADEADLHEESGQIEARGHVIVTREK